MSKGDNKIGMALIDSELKSGANTNISPKRFTEEYIQSPKYSERLSKSGYDVESEISERISNVSPVKTYGQYGAVSPQGQLKAKEQGRPFKAGGGSSYLPKEDAIVIDHKQAKKYDIAPKNIEAHEFGHAETSVGAVDYDKDTGIRKSRLNKVDNNQIISRLKDDASKVYKEAPDEIKSDLNALRYELKDMGLYDAGTEDFDKSILNELDNSYIKKRLLKNYSEDDLEWLMNNIAMNEEYSNTEPEIGLELIT